MNEYILGEEMGKGSYGKVREALNTQTLKHVAIKIIKLSVLKRIKDGQKSLEREIHIMKRLQHDNIIRLYAVIIKKEKEKIYIVIEFAGAGSLQNILNSTPNHRLPMIDVHHYFKQLINGLEYIHNQGIIHQDIKPANLLITPNRQLKISDFGVAAELDLFSSDVRSNSTGSPAFQSPQIAAGEKNFSGFKSDIWSCGVTLFYLVTGMLPFEGANVFTLYQTISKCEYTIPDHVKDPLRDLITKILEKDESKRLSIAQIKEHPWFVNGPSSEEKNEDPVQVFDHWKSGTLLTQIKPNEDFEEEEFYPAFGPHEITKKAQENCTIL